ncbi:MAG: holo-ACP synthase [Proteobacteria bacterium]|nr:holo-ACP synthase [Pseudomonadota bacterium]
MIFGIGTDLCEVSRIERVYSKYGEHFVNRLLMPREHEQFARTKRKVRFLAMHFAAKEAIVKAMGTGFRQGIWIRDVGFIQEASGKPVPIFSANAKRKCEEIGAGEGFVSLTDEAGMVAAFAVLLCK